MAALARLYPKAIAALMALLLAASSCLVFADPAHPAYADDVDDARTVLAQAQAKLEEIQKECDELNATVERLQGQIDETAQNAFSMQEVLAEGRESLGQIASYEYRNNTFGTMLGVFLGSTSLQEFTRNMDYLNLMARNQTAELEEQAARKAQYDSSMALLSAQKDAQEEASSDLEAKRAEAEKVVEEATAKLQDAEAAEMLRQQAAAFVPAPGNGSGGNSGSSGGGNGDSQGGGTGGGSGGGEATPPPSSGGWVSGGATAYNPTGNNTATGAPCTWNSMGVAVCMSMPNYRSYYGRKVEISYGGRTVLAVVNDCGGFGAKPWPTTMFDLQPGVWKWLGFSSAIAWGRRTVQYRFV